MSGPRYAYRPVAALTPTGNLGGTIHEVLEVATGRVLMRTWNLSDARSEIRYLNKYGEPASKRPPDHSCENWQGGAR